MKVVFDLGRDGTIRWIEAAWAARSQNGFEKTFATRQDGRQWRDSLKVGISNVEWTFPYYIVGVDSFKTEQEAKQFIRDIKIVRVRWDSSKRRIVEDVPTRAIGVVGV